MDSGELAPAAQLRVVQRALRAVKKGSEGAGARLRVVQKALARS